jgi:hypothetical protein
MFRLWSLAEQDLLSPDIMYRLRDTGQGLNRVQAAPKTSRMMQAILHRAQKSIGNWVGSSVIHMGDHNVPNALMFIGTYRVVPHAIPRQIETNLICQTNTPKFIAFSYPSAPPFRRFLTLWLSLRYVPISKTTLVHRKTFTAKSWVTSSDTHLMDLEQTTSLTRGLA